MYTERVATMTEAEVLAEIAALQRVQKSNPPSSGAWQESSEYLRICFNEMARRSGQH